MSRPPSPEWFFPTVTTAGWSGRATRAEVNLDAIAANATSLLRATRSGRLMAVVKANGYGHGAVAVARTALQAGAEWLAVYAVDEGISLRRGGIEAPILVFGPFHGDEARAIWQWGLTPTITALEAAEALQRSSDGGQLAFHLKLDTGLQRAGVDPAEAVPLMEALRAFPALRPQGLYTHFASADERSKEPTWRQLRLFLQTAEALAAAGFSFPLRHAANSAATLDLPGSHLDLVRTGISLYGYYPSTAVSTAVPLRPALSLLSVVTRVHRIAAGTGVGYGHEFRCTRDSVIALLSIGYGDGLPRSLGHGTGSVLLHGRPAPIVGRVSMDQITVDVTDIPEVQSGDTTTLIGAQEGAWQSADHLADQAGTISYDILTGLLPRVPRLYVRGGRLVGVMDLHSGTRMADREPVPAMTIPSPTG